MRAPVRQEGPCPGSGTMADRPDNRLTFKFKPRRSLQSGLWRDLLESTAPRGAVPAQQVDGHADGRADERFDREQLGQLGLRERLSGVLARVVGLVER